MNFCTNCGCKLSKGLKFCTNCGTQIAEISEEKQAVDIKLPSSDWSEAWSTCAKEAVRNGNELGLIITRIDALCQQLNCDKFELINKVAFYTGYAAERGVTYFLYDVECEDIVDILAELKDVIDVARPKYLMILGNEEIIPTGVWDNQNGDSDPQVFSDIPYALLDGTSPWEGQNFNLSEALRVGRVPSYENEGLDTYWLYFENAQEFSGTIDQIVPFGLSTVSWEDLSNVLYQNFDNNDVNTCPEDTNDTISEKINGNENLFYFNLHGSNQVKYWIGEDNFEHPMAFEPQLFNGYQTPFFLGVEACYGARYMDGLTAADSTLFSALQNKCLSFLGSTTIALGVPAPSTAYPDGSCADVLVGEYLKNIQKGETAGDSYINALKVLVSSSQLNDGEIKTFAQFALYGDPSVSTGKNKNVGKMKTVMKSLGIVPKGIKINLPDVRKAVHLVEAEVNEKINRLVDDYVFEKYFSSNTKSIEKVEQNTYKLSNSGLYVKNYSQQNEYYNQLVKAYFTEEGKIKYVLTSK